MLVSEDHVIEGVKIAERGLDRDPPGVCLRYNHTEPSVMRDGVDFIAVIEEREDTYQADYAVAEGLSGFECYVTTWQYGLRPKPTLPLFAR